MLPVDEKFKPFGIRVGACWKLWTHRSEASQPAPSSRTWNSDTADRFSAALAAESGPVFGDVPNVSDKSPVVAIGDLVRAAP
jgi:hypothetical protein